MRLLGNAYYFQNKVEACPFAFSSSDACACVKGLSPSLTLQCILGFASFRVFDLVGG